MDLATMAAVNRAVGRARKRLGDMSQWDVDPCTALDLLLEELKVEMQPKGNDRWGDPIRD